MPLGLELAASWVNVLSLADIAAEIQSSLDFLHTDELDFPRRQHNMRAVFDSTWDRLSEGERDVFSRISVFRGGCTCQAAQSITDASLPMLATLVHRSLLRYDREDDRYQIHELLRQYAAEKLAKTPLTDTQVRDQHSAYYCRWIREQEADFRSEAHQAAYIAIESEIENIRVAWMWAVERVNLEQIRDAADMMGNFYNQSGLYQQGEHAFQLAAKALNEGAPLNSVYIKNLTWQAVFSDKLGRSEQADRLLQKCLDLLDSPVLEDQDMREERAFVYLMKGQINRDADPELAITFLQKSLDLYRELDDGWYISSALRILGNLARLRGAYEDAKRMLEEALEIRQEYGNRSEIARNLSDLSHVSHFQGKYVEAERLVRKAFEIYMAEGDWYSSVIGRISLGITLLSSNNIQEGYILLLESIELLQKRGDVQLLALTTINVGRALLHLGKYEEAYDTGQKGLSLYREIGPWAHAGLPLLYLSWEALGKKSYQEAQHLANEAAEANKELGDIARECGSLAVLGFAQLELGKIRESQSSLIKSLQMTSNIGAYYFLLLAFSALALHMLLEGEIERGIELYSLVSRYQAVSGSRWFEDAVGQQIDAAAARLPKETVAESKQRGQSLDLWQTAVDLSEELPERGWKTNFPE
jgi:tetratricopeptide (TPR) repeat protein